MSTDLVVHPDKIQNFFDKTILDQIHLTAIDPEKVNGAIARNFGTDVQGCGPKFIKQGKWVVYLEDDLNGFMVERHYSATAEYLTIHN